MEPARKFKIIVNSKECGTCSGSSPSVVAKKVVKKLCGSSSKVVKFSLKECKRGCERVCGPYQGRMEKLDRPCKRDGKTITHRVVCGKVRKMRGGHELVAEDFSKEHYIGEFTIKEIYGKKYFFIGGDDDNYYSLAYYYNMTEDEYNNKNKHTNENKRSIETTLVVKILINNKIIIINNSLYKGILEYFVDKDPHKLGNVREMPLQVLRILNKIKLDIRNTGMKITILQTLFLILQNFYNNIIKYEKGKYFKQHPILTMKEYYGIEKNELLEYFRPILAKKIVKKFIQSKHNSLSKNEYIESQFTELFTDESIKEKFGLEFPINIIDNETIADAIEKCKQYLISEIKRVYKKHKEYMNNEKQREEMSKLENNRETLAEQIVKKFIRSKHSSLSKNEYIESEFDELLTDESIKEIFELKNNIENRSSAINKCKQYLIKEIKKVYRLYKNNGKLQIITIRKKGKGNGKGNGNNNNNNNE